MATNASRRRERAQGRRAGDASRSPSRSGEARPPVKQTTAGALKDAPDSALRRTYLNVHYVPPSLALPSPRLAGDAFDAWFRDAVARLDANGSRRGEYVSWLRERLGVERCRDSREVLSHRAQLDQRASALRREIKRLDHKREAAAAGSREQRRLHQAIHRRRLELLSFAPDATVARNRGDGGRPSTVAHRAYALFEAVARLLGEEVVLVVRDTYAHLSDGGVFARRELNAMRQRRFRMQSTPSPA